MWFHIRGETDQQMKGLQLRYNDRFSQLDTQGDQGRTVGIAVEEPEAFASGQ